LRVFGSICHKHIPDQRRKKLDDNSEPFILVGYHPTSATSWSLENDAVTQCILEDRVEISKTSTVVMTITLKCFQYGPMPRPTYLYMFLNT